ncbi:arabinogalactan endo-1,4-beta-galactosidase [Phenylobacterium montanum]|uniref:Arabinogalactan endo-beta-1,4-galactanase n=1 Tax=Phenylobacterium montanum TaxID=2823693 RepID=A0A975G019_9CAUL|nr:arabinogalactan endo-1,4-beta-galactosidase [Caulobacter sp. S6]
MASPLHHFAVPLPQRGRNWGRSARDHSSPVGGGGPRVAWWRGLAAAALLAIGTPTVATAGTFYFGADLSYVNEMQDCGAQYRDHGQVKDPFEIFKDHGANLVRVRLWNDPDWTRYSNLADVEKTIARAKGQGMQVLLDFHYSDTWADGDKQIAPKAWASITDTGELSHKLYQFTFDTLAALNAKGLAPDLVQVGNETNPELLGGVKGKPIDWTRNAALLNAGIQAVHDAGKAFPSAPRVMLHIAQPENAEWWFPQAAAAGVKGYDLIGLSYYPKWSSKTLAGLGHTILMLRKTYGVDVMVVETAYPWTLDNADSAPNLLGADALLPGYPATPEGQAKYLADLTQTVIDHGGDGVVYWEPAWVSTGCSTPWAKGSGWDNATFFDFRHGDDTLPGIDFMNRPYLPVSRLLPPAK